ncbi:MAG: DUF839 domain-containing protein [Rhodovarius sp.]|nr:DUF839 domain-containing protein [Rhodovarius sp.]
MHRRSLLLAGLAAPALAQTGAPSWARPAEQAEVLGPGYRLSTLIRWGDAVLPSAPAWNPAAPDPAAAAAQFGWDARLIAVIAPPLAADGIPRAVVAVAHPGVDPAMAFPDGRDRPEVAARMQGASLLNLERRGHGWVLIAGGFQSRRLDGATLCGATGPGADRLGGAVTGLFGIGAGCVTPDGRLLLLESEASDWEPRLPGRVGAGHGWVVDLDPLDPLDIPHKRTALGRGAQSISAAATADQRSVVYLALPAGLARFVAAQPQDLDQGRLEAARFAGGRLSWLPLPENAWSGLAAAVAAAGATRLAPGTTLAPAPGGLLMTAPDTGTSHIRHDGDDPAAPGASIRPLAAGPGQAGALLDPAGRLWRASPGGPGLAAVLIDPQGDAAVAAPRGATLGGLGLTPDGTAILTCFRRPGAEPGRSFARPATRWPDFTPGVPPRSALIALHRGGAPL